MDKRTIAVINGPNLNILGIREPEYYGKTTLAEIIADLKELGDTLSLNTLFFQSNHEGDIVDYIQEHWTKIDGLIINPAGLSKTGYPILDAITAYQLPFVEVHLSNIYAREQWHSESIFSQYALGVISGLKEIGYETALRYMNNFLKQKENGNQVKAVCFDFDGVIIDSAEVQKAALIGSYKRVVGDDNLPSIDEFFSHSGDSLANIFNKMQLPEAMIEPYREISIELIDKIKVHDGMVCLLEQLKMQGIKLGLCTGKERKRTIMILKKLNLYQYFDAIVCSDEVENPKPDPESLIKLMRQLGVIQDYAVMIGDSHNDVECAKAIYMPSIGVMWGEANIYQMLQSKPDYIVSDVHQLNYYIGRVLEEKVLAIN